jgi:hypothetical protein
MQNARKQALDANSTPELPAARDCVKYVLTIKRNEHSPSREIAVHNQRNAKWCWLRRAWDAAFFDPMGHSEYQW